MSAEPVLLRGMAFAPLTCGEVVDRVFRSIHESRGGWLITANADHLRRYCRDEAIRDLYRGADLVVADGFPIVWASRLQGTPLPERVAGSDLVWLLAGRAAAEDRSIYLLGGEAGAARVAADTLQRKWPQLRIAGASAPRVASNPDTKDVESIARELEARDPDIVYVGLGSPKQELLIQRLRLRVPRAWLLGVGISLSFIAGTIRRAPGWVQQLGLEWVYRLAQEPRRLARRYLLEDLPFVVDLLANAPRSRI